MELIDEKYLEFIRRQTCLVCNRFGVQAHHVQSQGAGRNDYLAVPLCAAHHTGPRGVENVGRETFQEEHEINFKEAIFYLLARYTRKGK